MKQNKKKVYAILAIFLTFAIFLVILLFNNIKDTPESITENESQSNENNTLSIYGEPDEEDIERQNRIIGESKPLEYVKTEESIFEKSDNTDSISSYKLGKPEIVENAEFVGISRKIIATYKGNIYVHNMENKVSYYDSNLKETTTLVEEVDKAFPTTNQPFILFEKKTDNGFTLYNFDFEKNKDGFQNIVTLAKSATDFGRIGDFHYFKTQEEPNKTYYLPTSDSSTDSELIGFNEVDGIKIDNYGEKLISFDSKTRNIYEVEFGKTTETIENFPVISNFENIVHLEANPYRPEKLIYAATFSAIENDLLGSKLVINGVEVPDIENILDLEWVDRESIVYQVDSHDGEIYLYNFRTKEKHLLDVEIGSFSFDTEQKTLYYLKSSDTLLRKIKFH